MRSWLRAVCVAFAALSLGACEQIGIAPPVACVLGTGVFSFIPLQDGDDLRIYTGPRGGYLHWLSLLARGLNPQLVTMRIRATDADTGQLVADRTERFAMSPFQLDDVLHSAFSCAVDGGALIPRETDGGGPRFPPAERPGEWVVTTGVAALLLDSSAPPPSRRLRFDVALDDGDGGRCSVASEIHSCRP